MALSAFDDKSRVPSDGDVAEVLGSTARWWDDLRGSIGERHGPVEEAWKHYGKAGGWTLTLRGGKRTLLYLVPLRGSFLAGVVLGKKAVEAARASALPSEILRRIEEAREYVEGRPVRVEVKRKADLGPVKALVRIKVEA